MYMLNKMFKHQKKETHYNNRTRNIFKKLIVEATEILLFEIVNRFPQNLLYEV